MISKLNQYAAEGIPEHVRPPAILQDPKISRSSKGQVQYHKNKEEARKRRYRFEDAMTILTLRTGGLNAQDIAQLRPSLSERDVQLFLAIFGVLIKPARRKQEGGPREEYFKQHMRRPVYKSMIDERDHIELLK